MPTIASPDEKPDARSQGKRIAFQRQKQTRSYKLRLPVTCWSLIRWLNEQSVLNSDFRAHFPAISVCLLRAAGPRGPALRGSDLRQGLEQRKFSARRRRKQALAEKIHARSRIKSRRQSIRQACWGSVVSDVVEVPPLRRHLLQTIVPERKIRGQHAVDIK